MKKYIPKHKSDVQAIDFLNTCSLDDIRADIPRLLEWTQDLHWDVAHGISAYFISYVNEIKDELKFILNSDDEEWKFGIMAALIGKSKEKLDEDLLVIIRRISENLTGGELSEEVVEKAKEILSNYPA